MKLLLVLLLLGAVVKAEEEKCEEGATWMMDCNQCTCMNGLPACTEMACLPGVNHAHKRQIEPRHKRDSGDLIIKDNSYKQHCKNGDMWKDQDCNRCHCDVDKAVCTKRKCSDGQKLQPTPGWENMFNIHSDRRKRSDEPYTKVQFKRETESLIVKANSYKQHCKPGDVWKDQDCNKCYCDDTLKAAVCTKKRCPNGQLLEPTPGWEDIFNIDNNRKKRSEELRLKRDTEDLVVKDNSYKQHCVPGDEWKDQDCNRCYCEDDKIAVCTKRRCSDGQKLEPTPGWQDIFNINKNRDKRSGGGSSVVKPDSYSESCVLGDQWMDQDCNECYCDGNGAVCSRRLCSGGKRLTPTPGWEQMFNIDENIANNSQERRKRSEDLVVKPNSYKQGCVDGDLWMDQDCNKCNCNNKIPRCTRKMCPDSKKLDTTPGWENKFNIKN